MEDCTNGSLNMPRMTAEQIIDVMDLEPLPVEGGWFRETYRSGRTHDATRSLSTAIYYLLTDRAVSRLHRLRSTEVYHFYLGDPVTVLMLEQGGASRVVTLGNDLEAGHAPQLVVPAHAWQGSVLADGGQYALMGTTMAPGFEPRDFSPGDPEELASRWPEHHDLIHRLAPPD